MKINSIIKKESSGNFLQTEFTQTKGYTRPMSQRWRSSKTTSPKLEATCTESLQLSEGTNINSISDNRSWRAYLTVEWPSTQAQLRSCWPLGILARREISKGAYTSRDKVRAMRSALPTADACVTTMRQAHRRMRLKQLFLDTSHRCASEAVPKVKSDCNNDDNENKEGLATAMPCSGGFLKL